MRRALWLLAALVCAGAGWLALRAGSEAELAPPPDEAPRARRSPEPAEEDDAELERRIRALEALGYSGGSEQPLGASGVTVHLVERSAPGVNLYVSGHGPEAILIDNDGRELHRWRRTFGEAFPERADEFHDEATIPYRRARMLGDGRLLAIFESRGLIALGRDSRLLWVYDAHAHHDVQVAPDGRILVLIREAHVVPSYHPERPVLEDYVAVLDPSGVELERISVLECLRASGHMPDDVRPWGDVFHTNALLLLDGRFAARSEAFAAGNVLVSMRNTNQLAILDLDSERAVWSLSGRWRRQHDPSLLDDGTLLLFNNRARRQRSSVMEVDPLTGAEIWTIHSSDELDFASTICGSCRRLANGNTLIVGSEQARALEVERDGTLVWEFRNPHPWPSQPDVVAMLYDLVRIESPQAVEWLR